MPSSRSPLVTLNPSAFRLQDKHVIPIQYKVRNRILDLIKKPLYQLEEEISCFNSAFISERGVATLNIEFVPPWGEEPDPRFNGIVHVNAKQSDGLVLRTLAQHLADVPKKVRNASTLDTNGMIITQLSFMGATTLRGRLYSDSSRPRLA
ncbi:hypothetical protein BD413DRAFT_614885 [Trametes elegans]|nr:hypothetical protein BD413DRAFT_614885 [Trametes elegans]